MSIPKHFKKQARNSFSRNAETKSMRRTWSFEEGDLVKLKNENVWGLVVECFSSYYGIMTAFGRRDVRAGQLERVQPLPKQDNREDI